MTVRVNLPPGCVGFNTKDGHKYTAKPGTHVYVEDHHAKALKSNDYAAAGLVEAGPEKFFTDRTKTTGRWCKKCNRLWNAWNFDCGKCGEATVPEDEMHG
jgi:hypothetical protein